MESVVKMLVTSLSADRSPMDGGKPNTLAKAKVGPWVEQGDPSDAGSNVIPGIQGLMNTPSVRVGADTGPPVSQVAIFPTDEGVRTFPPVNVRQGISPTALTAATTSTAVNLQI